MTTLFEARTISMILTIPDIKELLPCSPNSVESLDKNLIPSVKGPKPLSIPIYRGSIVGVEQHNDDENISDLIVRVPNVNYLSLPYIHFSSNVTNFDHLHETESQQEETHIKRRAPICPLVKDSQCHSTSLNKNQTADFRSSNQTQSAVNLPFINTKRLAIAVRNISRAFTTTCKTKPSSNVNEITIIPVLPDVEIITENFQVSKPPKKSTRNQISPSKFFTPKILRIKRKNCKIKKKQSSGASIETKDKIKYSRTESPSKESSSENHEKEQENESKHTTRIKFNSEVEQRSTTGEKITSTIPIPVVNPESSSTHCYSSIPQEPSDTQTTVTDKSSNNISSSMEIPINITQLDSFISKENVDIKSPSHKDDETLEDNDSDIEERLYVVHPNGDTYSECYEITYELGPEYKKYSNKEQEQSQVSILEDQSSTKRNIGGLEYEDLASTVTGISKFNTNNYTEIDDNHLNQSSWKSQSKITNLTEVKFDLTENISQISNDQQSTNQPETISAYSSTQDNDQIVYTADTPVVYEDYTIILQILKNVLQIDQLLQPDETNNSEQK